MGHGITEPTEYILGCLITECSTMAKGTGVVMCESQALGESME